MYLHTRSGRTNNSFVCSNNTQSMPICFFFSITLYIVVIINYHYHNRRLWIIRVLFFILVIISVILTLLIDTKRYLKLHSLNIILVKSLYARDECWDQRNCGFQDSSDLFLLISSLVACTSVSRLPAVENIWRSISAPTARDAKSHTPVLESCCLPLSFFRLFSFSIFYFFFFFILLCYRLRLRINRERSTMIFPGLRVC